MTELDRSFDENVYDLNAILHPGSVFDHPRDVLADTTLSRAEKRAILASWASDAAAVTSCPSLRAIPGAKRTVSIDEILEALSSLDHSPKNPPGGKPARRDRPCGASTRRGRAGRADVARRLTARISRSDPAACRRVLQAIRYASGAM